MVNFPLEMNLPVRFMRYTSFKIGLPHIYAEMFPFIRLFGKLVRPFRAGITSPDDSISKIILIENIQPGQVVPPGELTILINSSIEWPNRSS